VNLSLIDENDSAGGTVDNLEDIEGIIQVYLQNFLKLLAKLLVLVGHDQLL
jgi:hypothetical protein